MKYRQLGKSGLKVSEISLGSWQTFGGYVDNGVAAQTLRTAYENGVNFFDTANVYGRGEAEKLVGSVLREFPRDSYVLATKVAGNMGPGPNDVGLSRKHIMEQCHASLKRLGVDYIDVYYCHRFDPTTPLDETLRAFDDLVRQGKILYIGVSKWTAVQIAQGLATVERHNLHPIIVNQPLYHMFERNIESEVIPLGEQHGFGQVVYSPLAQGLLTGKYRSEQDIAQGSRASINQAARSSLHKANLARVEGLAKLADELGHTLAQLALAWTLRSPNISSALIGASRPEQISENVKASGIQLPEETVSRIEAILSTFF
ncbi:aldo/keto reductase [Paenibacillaceae bacterium]|nr:aldo/keto reductase [Paenibacillaceae bacterium]